jgi:hypothetical protein
MSVSNRKADETKLLTDDRSLEDFNLLKHPILLSRPLRQVISSWSQHVPFAMFLIDLLRPRTFVELGTFTGVSYCAFCQAVKQLELNTRCYAIDSWKGDLHSGIYGQDVLNELREHHDPLYSSFSQLIQSNFEEVLPDFYDGSVDLLHIDGYHTYEAVMNDFTRWLPKMSDHGVILFHDINVYERDFGVWKLWKELKAGYSHFEFEHGYGLGLLAVGELQPAPLKRLIDAPENEKQLVRELFSRLGSDLESSLREKEEQQVISKRLSTTEAQLEQVSQQLKEKEEQIIKITSTSFWRFMLFCRRLKYKYFFAFFRKLGLLRAAQVDEAFRLGLDNPLPEELRIGKGNVLFISGWCFHTTRSVRKLEIIIGNRVHPVKIIRRARRDILDQHFPALDPNGNSYQSGFWITIAWPQLNETFKASFQLKATFSDRSEMIETIGTVTLKAEY